MAMSATELRANLYKILDEVIATQEPVEIARNGVLLMIVPKKKSRAKLKNLKSHPDVMCADPESFVHGDWSDYWKGEKDL